MLCLYNAMAIYSVVPVMDFRPTGVYLASDYEKFREDI